MSGRDFGRTPMLSGASHRASILRGWVVSGVVVVHLGGLLGGSRAVPPALPPEMAVSLLVESVPARSAPQQPAPVTPLVRPLPTPSGVMPRVIATTPLPTVAPAPFSSVPSTPLPLTAPAKMAASNPPALPDREPDYQARYLNNPQPVYPAMATRMGWQGKVILSVEVLRDGRAGQVSVQRSSGHAVLDDAALQAVRSWRFVPARRDGQFVDQVFFVPLPFILKDSDE